MKTAETSPETIRLVLADDHTLFREGVASLLAQTDDIELVGEAATGEEAIRLAEELLPDVVLMDLKMPESNFMSINFGGQPVVIRPMTLTYIWKHISLPPGEERQSIFC